jgi:hypothetical protein
MTRLIDLIEHPLAESLAAPSVAPSEDPGPDLITTSSVRPVYITHPGPNGPVHQCQEVPY